MVTTQKGQSPSNEGGHRLLNLCKTVQFHLDSPSLFVKYLDRTRNNSLVAPGTLTHRLKIKIGCQGAPEWSTGSVHNTKQKHIQKETIGRSGRRCSRSPFRQPTGNNVSEPLFLSLFSSFPLQFLPISITTFLIEQPLKSENLFRKI